MYSLRSVFSQLALEMKATITLATFIHEFIVHISMPKHGCQIIEMLFTKITLHWWVTIPKMFVHFMQAAEGLVAFSTRKFTFCITVLPFQFILDYYKSFLFSVFTGTFLSSLLLPGFSIFTAVPKTHGNISGNRNKWDQLSIYVVFIFIWLFPNVQQLCYCLVCLLLGCGHCHCYCLFAS